MRFLAEFIMRGRVQACAVAAVAAAVPMLFWLAGAVSALVVLRRGLSDGLNVAFWGLMPALIWSYWGNPKAMLLLIGVLVLAGLLRSELPWRWVVLVSIPLGGLYALVIDLLQGAVITEVVSQVMVEVLPKALPEVWEQLQGEEQLQVFEQMASVLLTGVLGALLQVVTLLSLMLARYWQALLYNLGGFGKEFQALRFSPTQAGLLVLGVLLAPNLGISALLALAPLCSVPLVLASLALVHGMVAQGRVPRFWLVGLYVSLVLFLQFIYPLLAILAVVDSLFDFRGRTSSKKDEPGAGGQG